MRLREACSSAEVLPACRPACCLPGWKPPLRCPRATRSTAIRGGPLAWDAPVFPPLSSGRRAPTNPLHSPVCSACSRPSLSLRRGAVALQNCSTREQATLRCLPGSHSREALACVSSLLPRQPCAQTCAALGANFCAYCGEGVRLHFFTCGYLIAQHRWWERRFLTPLKCLGTLQHSFQLALLERDHFLLFSIKCRFTTIIGMLLQVTPCRSLRSPAGLAIRARGPAKASTRARSTRPRPTITRYAGPSTQPG